MSNEVNGADAVIKHKTGISAIWLLPIIAALIGAGMFYQEWQSRGQHITISFENALGLEINKTRVKYKNVDIGTLDDIEISESGDGILAKVLIKADMTRFLRSDSQFWVVRPRVGSSGISGINTLLSGAYINLEVGQSERFSTRFTGLEIPPVASPNAQGLKLNLMSSGGKLLQEGNPVLYRGFAVGVVETVNFDVDLREISYGIFINAPYHNLITSNTFFWNAGGFELTTNVEGISVDFSSVEAFLSGGVQFDVPEDLSLGERITETADFTLYPNKTSISEQRGYEYLEFVILVEDSVAGIQIGTPVEYRGIRIGRVSKPYLGFSQTQEINPDEERIAVVIHIEPRRLTQNNDYSLEWFNNQFLQWIRTGLEASVVNANYLTGAMKISLDMNDGISRSVERFGDYFVIPVGQTGFDGLLEKTDSLLAKLNALDIENLIANANQTMQSADSALQNVDEVMQNTNNAVIAAQAVIMSMEQTMLEAQQALQGLQPESPLYRELQGNLMELQKTMEQLQPFVQQISAKPNLLIFGDEVTNDIQPKGKKSQ
jgi:paraquat-inducible protein B